jgi:hypothetical protein
VSRKNPHVIMGQTVQGSAKLGYTVELKRYRSTTEKAYQPDAQEMLCDLKTDLDRLQRLINVRAHKLNSMLSDES